MSDWRHEAACLEEDPELFFPIGNTGPAILQIAAAKAVCRRCDVVQTCLRWATDTGQDAGVWGGLSEDERRALKRRNGRARRAENGQAPFVLAGPAAALAVTVRRDWNLPYRDVAAALHINGRTLNELLLGKYARIRRETAEHALEYALRLGLDKHAEDLGRLLGVPVG